MQGARRALMEQTRVPAIYMRGGTSRGLFFRREWLPDRRADWDPIFLAALGSPDPYGRQLDGLGGGISSLSKVMVVERSRRPDADLDYIFGQVAIGDARVEYRTNCGNLTAAVGPFAVDEGLVTPGGDAALVRLYNANTEKRVIARFPIADGEAAVEGEFELAGVAGRGAPIRLDFLDPGGALTGRLLPTGKVLEPLPAPGLGEVPASIVDATSVVVFVPAAAVGIGGAEGPAALEADATLLQRLEAIRAAAAVRIGLATTPAEATQRSRSVPMIAVVAPPQPALTLDGQALAPAAMDVTARALSMGRPHRAIPLTGAMCLAVAARIEGTVVHAAVPPRDASADEVRIAHPSGVLALQASVRRAQDWVAEKVVVWRSARRLMEGRLVIPASRLRMPSE